MGINPGSSYGDAKRWYPDEFANVASALSVDYDIVIFGGPGEKDIAGEIEKNLIEKAEELVMNREDHQIKEKRKNDKKEMKNFVKKKKKTIGLIRRHIGQRPALQ